MNSPADHPAISLAERARALGVADRYHGFWGKEETVPETVLQQAIAAMAGDGREPVAQHLGLPPVHVVREGEARDLRWTSHESTPARWTLSTDDAGTSVASGELQRSYQEARIALPAGLAAGYYRIALEGAPAGEHCRLVVAPAHCYVAPGLQQGERWWGCTIQLYALRSSRNWGVGDFGDLRRLCDAAAHQGASFIGLSPLHALFPHNPATASPYSPSSRKALNPIYLDVQALVDLSGCEEAQQKVQSEPFQEKLHALREAEMVDYEGVARAKEEVLRILWRHFERHELDKDRSRGAHFLAYMREREHSIGRHALFEALQDHLYAQDPAVWGWPAWPEEYRDVDGPAVRAFQQQHVSDVRFRFWLQWLAEVQLESCQRYARTRGMGIGLYCDLAVGVNGGGAETWMEHELFALGMHAGAPPDPLAPKGQDWGLPPWSPQRLKEARYQPFIDTLRANMRHSGALRLDHVMALMRLFWTGPDGGTYVEYPLEDLMAVLALESQRHQCMVIGEDLGNVAPRMREAMQAGNLLSYRPLLFEREEDGGFKRPAHWQPKALAVVSTHDLPTLRGFWLGEDIELSEKLHLYPDAAAHENQVLSRAQDRARLLLALQREDLLPEGSSVQPTSLPDATPAFVDAVYAFLARTPCWLVGVQLEDVTGQLLQVNVPGTTEDRFPNWRRKLSVTVEGLASDARWASLAAVLRAERSGPSPLETAPLELPALETASVPCGTYRVQFHKGFTFEDAAQALPYLQALGASHLYSSPYLRARPGSTHGYDIIDHGQLNPEVGDELAHARMCQALRRNGMGQILDIVPNHMGVLEADNAWWLDVLEHGRASSHAETFDIEWNPAQPEMAGRVLLPVLGDHFGKVLEAGEIQLYFEAEAGEFGLRYWDHRFPIDPSSYPEILSALPAPPARDDSEGDSHAVVASLLDAFGRLPSRDDPDEDQRRARVRDAAVYKRQLARLASHHEWLARWIEACVQRLNGQAGEPDSFDALERLIASQAYRLADWRVASDDVNYRRFFDVNTLAGLRMERTEVFEATHRKVLHWLQDGLLSGLRIDHPDGLSDPLAYFEQLQSRYAGLAEVGGHQPRALYLVVEKILAEHESLPEDWPVHGDTGYRFGTLVNGLFVEPRNENAILAAYQAFTGETTSFDEVLYQCKKLIIETSLYSELNWLAHTLHRLTRGNRRRCDFTRNRLRWAMAEVAAAFPVYRTYLRTDEAAGAMDRRHIDWAIAAAERRLGKSEATVLQHLKEVLLGEGEAANLPQDMRRRFLARWQQFTAPVTAKAMEDTAFYRYVPLLSLNEVGGDPRSFGVSVAAFHFANQQRQRHRPHCLLGTSTHDSKRGEDLRARIDVLSEIPAQWEDCLLRLSGWAHLYVTKTPDQTWPSNNDVWILFQTLVGMWPAEAPDEAQREDLRQRVQAYMRKAVREAKLNTTWVCPENEYEEAVERYVDGVLRAGANPFADELQKITARIAPFGFRNSLAQVALKFTAPGVPDVYQGCEQWNFSLVDPDNRRPVDYAALAQELEAVNALYLQRWPAAQEWAALHRNAANGRIKQLVTWRLLRLRRERSALFRQANYVALSVDGPAEENAVAFARIHEREAVLVVTARLTCTLCRGEDANWSPRLWQGTTVGCGPEAAGVRRFRRWRNWLTGVETVLGNDDDAAIDLEALFAGAGGLPFVVLVAEAETA
ncbi:malto-oligosyltrehalose synthase [Ramlibacter sp. USB13]|uniref:4-alpha-glucanotransferase n=1 Tax=Ramlibacter cellulosilyticus TaxID=2764187 RepID=A0A923MUX5_9BURK|nr:malto-oligosyltrehalose synthase [Ramlibacter cellulosilyticus]MBC5785481.1 malto-oligosyltrehalose synthase [Ramlibacter cellulosilyticus]